MKKNLCVLVFATFFVMLFTGCPNENQHTQEESDVIIPVFEYFSENTALAISSFSKDLFRNLLESDEENIVVSPLAAYYVLSMASLGAKGDTLYEFESLLGGESHQIARELSALSLNFTSVRGSPVINMAGSVWISDDVTVNPEFNRNMTTYFHAPALSRNFGEQPVVHEINDWIYGQTQGLINNAFEIVQTDTAMLLVNTLYFSSRWARYFNTFLERQGVFYSENGEPNEITFLYTGRINLPISITEYYEAVLIPYAGRFGFLMVRPTIDISVRDFVASHDLFEIFNELEMRSNVHVSMPMLDVEYDVKMKYYLKMMGLELAFDDELSGLNEIAEGGELIYLSEVRQKIRLTVHAEGTGHGAITEMIIPRYTCSYPLVLNFNTPHVFMIYDSHLNIPLFMGVTE